MKKILTFLTCFLLGWGIASAQNDQNITVDLSFDNGVLKDYVSSWTINGTYSKQTVSTNAYSLTFGNTTKFNGDYSVTNYPVELGEDIIFQLKPTKLDGLENQYLNSFTINFAPWTNKNTTTPQIESATTYWSADGVTWIEYETDKTIGSTYTSLTFNNPYNPDVSNSNNATYKSIKYIKIHFSKGKRIGIKSIVYMTKWKSAYSQKPANFSYSSLGYEYTAYLNYNDVNTFTGPTFNNPNKVTGISFSSSQEGVATVDQTGKVTLVGPGTTVIKASYESTGDDDPFTSGEAQYTLIVKNSLDYTFDFRTNTYNLATRGATGNTAGGKENTIQQSGIKIATTGKMNLASNDGIRLYEGAVVKFTAPNGCSFTEAQFTSKTPDAFSGELNADKTVYTIKYLPTGDAYVPLQTVNLKWQKGIFVAKPVFLINNDHEVSGTINAAKGDVITASCATDGATIAFTVNGKTEQGPYTLEAAGTYDITAVASYNNDIATTESETATLTAIVKDQVATPSFSLNGIATTGEAINAKVGDKLTLKSTTAGCSYTWSYTFNGGASNTIDGSELEFNAAGTYVVTGKAAKEGLTESEEAVITVTVTLNEAGISFPVSAITGYRNRAFVSPVLANPNELTISYASSNTDVATVNDDGTVTLEATGVTTITATSTATTKYAEGNVSYTLTVEESMLNYTFDFVNNAYELGERGATGSKYPASNKDFEDAASKINVKTGAANIRLMDTGLAMGAGATITFTAPQNCSFTEASFTSTKDAAFISELSNNNTVYTIKYTVTTGNQSLKTVVLNWKNSIDVATPVYTKNGHVVTGETITAMAGDEIAVTCATDNTTVKLSLGDEKVDNPYTIADDATGVLTFKAVATFNGSYQTAEATLKVTIETKVDAPVFKIGNNVVSGEVSADVFETLTVASPTAGSTITWNINETTIEGTSYEFNAKGSYIFKAKALKEGDYVESNEVTLTVNVNTIAPKLSFAQNTVYGILAIQSEIESPALEITEGLSATYSSNNAAVATVDATTGKVTLNGVGTAVITATYAGGDQYSKAEAIYTLNVEQTTPATGEFFAPNAAEHTYYATALVNNSSNVLGEFTSNKASIKFDSSAGKATITNGAINLERKSMFTVSVPDGYVITSIKFNANPTLNVEDGNYSNGIWTPSVNDAKGDTEYLSQIIFTANAEYKGKDFTQITVDYALSVPAQPEVLAKEGVSTNTKRIFKFTKKLGINIFYRVVDGTSNQIMLADADDEIAGQKPGYSLVTDNDYAEGIEVNVENNPTLEYYSYDPSTSEYSAIQTLSTRSDKVSVDEILGDDAEATYYDLQGHKLNAAPEKGIFIVVKGGKAYKAIR